MSFSLNDVVDLITLADSGVRFHRRAVVIQTLDFADVSVGLN